jgi:excisionase family DNA binding protein
VSTTDTIEPLENQTYTVEQAGQILGLKRKGAYSAAAAGKIPTIRLGLNRIRVPKVALQRLLDGTD